jgi:hypothetical protein
MPANPQKVAQANRHPLNKAALARLKQAKADGPETYQLHLLALAWWGLEQGAQAAGRDAHQHSLVEGQLGRLESWEPQNVLKWLVNSPEGPDDPAEQQASLRRLLADAPSPKAAAAHLLEWIGDRMQAGGVSAFQPAASELR